MGSWGERVARARRRRSWTQEQLAEKAGVSEALVKKVEQGSHGGVRLTTLYALAGALEVPPGYLLDEAEGDVVKEPEQGLLLPLRRLLLPIAQAGGSLDEAELTLARLRRRVIDSTADFNHARYAKLAAEIPALVISIEAAVDLHEGEAKEPLYRLLARTYILAAETVILLRDESLAYEAVRRAMDAAEKAGDPVLRASAGKIYTWAFTRQGMFAEAEAVAVRMADEIGEPSMKKAAPEHIAVWGELHRIASRAAAHDNRPDTARNLLSVAYSAAVRIDGGTMDYGKHWAILNPAMIGITKVEHALIEGDAVLALRIGEGVRRTQNLRLDSWTPHLRRRANAQTSTRDYAGAIETMKTIRRLAPEWIKNDREAHDAVLRLQDSVSVRRARSSGLAELVQFMGVEP